MKKERRDTLMASTQGLKEITHLCVEMGFDFKRLIEFVEDERGLKIINELMEKTCEISTHCIYITAICKTVADGKSGVENVGKTIRKITNRETKIINEEEET